ncbi:MAG: type IX secretion system membrane protein PorP/SprF [Cyclobacteriaceae bacterium]|nr:type IX secretion system membrane protein PorP/SprF [Cyclobacteriaceae bacterium]
MKTRWLAFYFVLTLAHCAQAQQDPLYGNYINNPYVINPAYGGLTNNLSATINYRYQWTGFEGSPVTWNANGHISLAQNKMGVGLMLVSDQSGASQTNELFASYSYRLPLDDRKTLSFGLQGGFSDYQTNNDEVNPYDANDPFFVGKRNKVAPNLGTGLILSSDRYYVSLSVPRLLEISSQQEDLTASQYSRHFYAMGSYLLIMGEHIRLRPSVLFKGVQGSPSSIDLNAALIFHEKYQAGLLTRDFSTYGLFTLMQIKDFLRVGYVFEVPGNGSVGSQYVTHELTLGFRFNALPFHSNESVFSF